MFLINVFISTITSKLPIFNFNRYWKYTIPESPKFINNEKIKFVFLGGAQFPYLKFLMFLNENNIEFSLDIINRRHHENVIKK